MSFIRASDSFLIKPFLEQHRAEANNMPLTALQRRAACAIQFVQAALRCFPLCHAWASTDAGVFFSISSSRTR